MSTPAQPPDDKKLNNESTATTPDSTTDISTKPATSTPEALNNDSTVQPAAAAIDQPVADKPVKQPESTVATGTTVSAAQPTAPMTNGTQEGISDEQLEAELSEITNVYKFGIEADTDRLIAQTQLFAQYIRDNALIFTAGQNIKLVYDCGCGDGQLTKILAELLPNAKVIGLDSNADSIVRAYKNKAQSTIPLDNLEFQLWDFKDGFPGEPGSVDLMYFSVSFLYMRGLHEMIIQKAFEFLSPGGYLWIKELQEDPNNHTMKHPSYDKYLAISIIAFTKMGVIIDLAARIPKMMEEAGFINIKVNKETIPITNTTMSGRIAIGVVVEGIRKFRKTVARLAGVSELIIVDLLKDILKDSQILKGNWILPNIVGRKPL